MNFTVNKPLKGHDEDAPAYADDRMLIVCDGLGGGGQNAYLIDGEKRTSAYLGSRKISVACQEFFSAHYDEFCENMQNPGFLIAELKTYISNTLNQYVTEKGLKNIVRGKSMQMLPSTLAAIIYKHYEDHTDALVVSAGDSRAFVLTPDKGLQQISRDDVFDNVDAFEKSATMTNNIRQDGEFHINYGYFTLPPKCVLLVCTDGCFDYISTPMELEYRLEYSISKCGDLLDPKSDNLGEYFGNVLVKSGLKDDCTMAGVILGYTDSEGTKNLFLRRALHIQEKYRNPCAQYDKESLKRKDEVSAKLPDIESKITALKASVDVNLKNSLLNAFQQDLVGNAPYAPNGIRELIVALRGFDLYQKFLSELRCADEESARLSEEKNAEYLDERTRIKQIFKVMRFDDFVSNLLSFNPVNFFNSDRSRYASEYRRLQNAVNHAGREYTEALTEFSKVYEELRKIEPKKLKSMDDFAMVSIRYGELHRAFSEFVATKQELHRCKDSLKSFYMENDDAVEQEFISAWKRKFSAYTTRAQYKDIRASYDRCIELQTEIENCTPLTNEQKIEKFKAYLDSNLQAFVTFVKSDIMLMQLVCGTALNELAALEKQYEELKKYGNEFDDKKYALWMEYKPVYELYDRCVGGKV